MKRDAILLSLATIGSGAAALAQSPVGTEFNYQGYLKQLDQAATGVFDIRFEAYDSDLSGSPLGMSCSENVSIFDGLFTVPVNFGSIFDGDRIWIEVAVRADTGSFCDEEDGYMILVGRQPLSAVPYALKVPGIDGHSLDAADGAPLDALLVDNAGNVGIGTNSPATRLHVNGQSLWLTNGNGNGLSPSVGPGLRIYDDGTRSHIFSYNYASNSPRDLSLQTLGGKVGVGTSNPLSGLHVIRNWDGQDGALRLGGDRPSIRMDAGPVGGNESWLMHVGSDGPGAFQLFRRESGSWLNYFNIQPSGNVGIGTFAPGAKLHVAGGNLRLENTGKQIDIRTDGGAIDIQSSTSKLFMHSSGPGGNNHIVMQPPTTNGVGNVGIGVENPTFLLHVNGSAGKPGGGSWSNSSDARLKKNIQPLDGALARMLALQGVTFEYHDPAKIQERPGVQIGMIAQQVESVFPDWVEVASDGYRRLTFRGFEALTVESIRELQSLQNAQLSALRAENASLKERLEKIEAMLASR